MSKATAGATERRRHGVAANRGRVVVEKAYAGSDEVMRCFATPRAEVVLSYHEANRRVDG